MKKQKIILYLVALVCFMVCFIVLNRKYDSFYRISGINNETRQLIINNLTEEEQEYLIENSFPGRTLEFSERIDASIIGGFIVDVDHVRMDASISNEIEKLRLKLLSTK